MDVVSLAQNFRYVTANKGFPFRVPVSVLPSYSAIKLKN